MKLILGIDVGTSGVKCLLTDETGRIVDSDTQTYPVITPRPAWSEQDPQTWWDGTVRALKVLFARHDPKDIAAVGLCGQMHGLVALDAQGEVIRNAILWNDQRTEEESAEIISRAGGPAALADMTNNSMLTGYTGGKILWLKKHEPENYARLSVFVLPKDYIRFRLTGGTVTDVSDASGTGFFDVKNSVWADGLLKTLDIRTDIFPDVVESDAVSGKVTKKASEATGIPEGIPVYGGGGDAVIQNAGMGIVQEGTLGVILGTSGVVATPMKAFGENAEGILQFFRSNEAGSYMVFGVQLASAGAMEWFRNTVYADSPDALKAINEEAAAVPAGSGGVCFLPYLSGERCPYPNPDARGVFYGLSLAAGRGAMARAVMEGVTFGLFEIYELMKKADPNLSVKDIAISGGGSKSALWKQITADVFQLPVKVLSGASEGGAYGAALVAAIGQGYITDLAATADLHEVEEVVQPDPDAADLYKKPLDLFRKLYSDLAGTFREFAQE